MNSSHPGFWEVKSCTPGGRGAYLLMGSFTTSISLTRREVPMKNILFSHKLLLHIKCAGTTLYLFSTLLCVSTEGGTQKPTRSLIRVETE